MEEDGQRKSHSNYIKPQLMSKCKVQVFQLDNTIYKRRQTAITRIQNVLLTGGRTAHKDYSLTGYHSAHQSWTIHDKFRMKDYALEVMALQEAQHTANVFPKKEHYHSLVAQGF